MKSDSESILYTIKKMLGLDPDYDPFDLEVMVDINAAFTMLRQLGVGPRRGFKITGDEEKWDDFLEDDTLVEMAKQFIYFRVKMVFEAASLQPSVIKALQEQADDLEWRMVVMAEGEYDHEQ